MPKLCPVYLPKTSPKQFASQKVAASALRMSSCSWHPRTSGIKSWRKGSFSATRAIEFITNTPSTSASAASRSSSESHAAQEVLLSVKRLQAECDQGTGTSGRPQSQPSQGLLATKKSQKPTLLPKPAIIRPFKNLKKLKIPNFSIIRKAALGLVRNATESSLQS